MDRNLKDAVSSCMLFAGMTGEEIDALLDCLKFKVRKYNKNEIMVMAGEPVEGVGIIISGQAAVIKESPAGDRIILSLLKQGDMFGETAAFSGNGTWPATVIAQTACSAMYAPPEKLAEQCARSCLGHRRLIINMLGILSRKAITLNRRLEYLSVKNLRGRLAAYLLEQRKTSGKDMFLLQLNRTEMADYLNVSRPSLSREMCRMRDEGIIDFHGSSIHIKDVEALKSCLE